MDANDGVIQFRVTWKLSSRLARGSPPSFSDISSLYVAWPWLASHNEAFGISSSNPILRPLVLFFTEPFLKHDYLRELGKTLLGCSGNCAVLKLSSFISLSLREMSSGLEVIDVLKLALYMPVLALVETWQALTERSLSSLIML